MKSILKTIWFDEKGATAIEYAMLASLIAAVIALAVAGTGTKVTDIFTSFLAAWA